MMKFLIQKNRIVLLLLCLIFILSLFLRAHKLGEYPVGFHIDEASLGYNGYSLLLTGKSDEGKFLPLYINMFGDNRPSGYHYLTIIPIIVFGLTEFSTRFPAALFGSLTVFPMFYLAYVFFKDKRIAVLSSLLLAVSPWDFVLSRASAEAIVALFFILLGFALIIDGIRNETITKVIPGSILLAFSFFFYHTPKVFAPMLFLAIIIATFTLWRKYTGNFKLTLTSCFILLSAISIALVFLVPGGTGRYSQVNIFNSYETDFQKKQKILEDVMIRPNDQMSPRIFHNKYVNYSYFFINNYLSYYTGEFLFTGGGLPIWYVIPRTGILFFVEFPFILIGIYYLISKKNIWYKIVLLWLILGPVVSAITLDDVPNINRSSVMFPVWELICAFGFIILISKVKYKKTAVAVFSLLLIFNFLYFMQEYYVNAVAHNPWYRNNGFKEMMLKVNRNYNKYDIIIISKHQGGAYPLVLFYSRYDPRKYQAEGSPKDKDYTGFGKYFFVPQDCPFLQTSPEIPKGKRIIVEKGGCYDDKLLKAIKHEYIYRTDKTKAFRIIYDKL